MPFLTQGKTNWKFLLIVVVLAAIVGGGILFYSRRIEVETPKKIAEEEVEEIEKTEEPEVFGIRQYAKKLCEEVEEKEGSSSLPLPKMAIGTIISGSFSSPGAKEFFIACQESIHPSMYERYFYIVDVGGNMVFEMEELRGSLDYVRSSLTFQTIDINNDGVLEIVWRTGVWGGTTTYAYESIYIYSLKSGELFKKKTGSEWVWAEEDDEYALIEIEPVFSENLENPEFQLFKDYLSSDSYYEWYKIHGEYEWYEIDGEIFFLIEGEQACFTKGTKITMSDDNYKNIEDIKKGDLVKSFNVEAKELKNAEVMGVIKREDPIVNINNVLKAAPDQLIYLADGSTKTAIELEVGDLLFNEITVDFLEYSPDKIETYDLILKDAVNFFANGYLVHTPNSNRF